MESFGWEGTTMQGGQKRSTCGTRSATSVWEPPLRGVREVCSSQVCLYLVWGQRKATHICVQLRGKLRQVKLLANPLGC